MLRRGFFIGIIVLCMFLGAIIMLCDGDWVDFSALETCQTAQPSVALDDQGNLLARFEQVKKTPISYDKIPDILIKAFLVTEDHNFFNHPGISLKGIIRSFFVNLYHLRTVQGASTITQQLARGMFLDYERTYWRKIREILLAFQLERQLSKEQILELYLNNIYFGRGIYGVQSACRSFWDKSLDAITVDEAATLAAVAASARLYSPLNAPANTMRRRNIILHSMLNLGVINQKEYDAAIKTNLHIHLYTMGNPMRLYLQEWIRAWAEHKWGKETLYHGGLVIKTTVNTQLQEKAERSFFSVVQKLRKHLGKELNGGMISLDPPTGAIKVMIGGLDFKQSQFNRAMQAQRQMGSSFKPILYSLALKAGIGMDTVFVDEPLEIHMPGGAIWKPNNWNNQFDGSMTLAKALTFSCNTVAIKLFLKIGANYVSEWAKLFGLTRQVTEYPSAALGTAETTAEENAAAFNVFANKGIYVKPTLVEWVKDASGNKLWQAEHYSRQILDQSIATKMVNVLSLRMLMAQKRSLDNWFDAESIGKTGSTNGAATTWFVGATPGLTTAIYVGRDDNKPMGSQLLAGRTTYPIWERFYKSIKHEKKYFYKDPRLRSVAINWITGQPASDIDDPNTVVLLDN